jgi:GH15 family glucan-1,4-alpha-glucosidase
MQWARIEDYALLGDLQAAALVGRDGSVDWLCLPRFDSPACFAALLGGEDAGRWRLAPAGASRAARRSYRGPTLVLDTEWVTGDGHVRVTEFMPPRGEAPDLVRIVEGLSGRVPMELELKLRFDYGSITPWVQRRDDGLTAAAGPDFVRLATPVELHGHHMMTEARFEVSAGQKVPFVLTHSGADRDEPKDVSAEQALADTIQFWTSWIQGCRYHGRWQNAVHRALITLKALTFAPTGGIAAAATTSLPEQPRGKRTGTTATAGCAMPPSRFRHYWGPASSARHANGGNGSCAPWQAIHRSCRSCTPSTARVASPSKPWTGYPGTRVPPRYASATTPPASFNSTCGVR